ncbi:Latrophilin Cirl [Holothuria leucospilota]|uniref:Latrophilin Cirl n=1 Tax=Holothuria leucospilota TaxID=206669 RepID=A0A9Q1BBS4_HOLLE|nr:Latrophilin Cirl [Holothuria leucospilota]
MSFPSVSLNTETVSNEHCVVPNYRKRSLTISDVPYISGDLVDITKAKTIGNADITHTSTVLNMISSVYSTSQLVECFTFVCANKFNSKFTCVFWDHILHEESAGWSSEGCHNEEANDSYVYICKCDHFGNMAVLVFLTNDIEVRSSNNTVLFVCIIVVIIIVATICTYLAIEFPFYSLLSNGADIFVQHARRRVFRYQENAINHDMFEPLELHS